MTHTQHKPRRRPTPAYDSLFGRHGDRLVSVKVVFEEFTTGGFPCIFCGAVKRQFYRYHAARLSHLVTSAHDRPWRHQQGVGGPGQSLTEVALATPIHECSSAGVMKGIGYPVSYLGGKVGERVTR